MRLVYCAVYHGARFVRHAWDWYMGPEVHNHVTPARITVVKGERK